MKSWGESDGPFTVLLPLIKHSPLYRRGLTGESLS
jgi:hypothetical protein